MLACTALEAELIRMGYAGGAIFMVGVQASAQKNCKRPE